MLLHEISIIHEIKDAFLEYTAWFIAGFLFLIFVYLVGWVIKRLMWLTKFTETELDDDFIDNVLLKSYNKAKRIIFRKILK